jgi:hypothetical protein
MTVDETRKIIDIGKERLNFAFAKAVQESIVRYSNGLASVCHQLCLNVCNAAGLYETSPSRTDIKEE